MKRLVLFTLVMAIAVSSVSVAYAAEVSVQRWQYYEQAVDEQLRSLRPTDTLYHSTPCFTHEEQERQEKLKNEGNAVIDEVITLAMDGNKKAQLMVEKLIMTGDPRLVKKLLVDGDPQSISGGPQMVKKLLAAGNPQLVKHYCLRPATVADYKVWLNGHLKSGGRIINFNKSPMAGSDELGEMWVAKSDFNLVPQHGTNSLQVIMPKGIKFLGNELGHNVLLKMDGYRQVGTAWNVSTFSDTGFE